MTSKLSVRPSGERQSVRVPADKLIASLSSSQAGFYFYELASGRRYDG